MRLDAEAQIDTRIEACWVSEYAPDMRAWVAMIAAAVASTTSGTRPHMGPCGGKGFSADSGSAEQQAPCPK